MNGEPLTILFVEDNPDHAELVMRSLENHPTARITHLADGEAALNYLFRRGLYSDGERWPLPHVMLLDLRLPKIDGLDVLKRIKTSGKFDEIPIIILTTSQAESDIGKAYRRHVNSYLVKPLDFDQFSQLMDEIGGYWLDWNRCTWSAHL